MATTMLRILALPQRIDGDQLSINVLVLPTQSLLDKQVDMASVINPGTTVTLPSFIQGTLGMQATFIKGLSSFPFSDPTVLASEGVTVDHRGSDIVFPENIQAVYEGLLANFPIDGNKSDSTPPVSADGDGIRKYLPRSYRSAFNFTVPRDEYGKTDDSYHCAIKRTTSVDPTFKQGPDKIPWGRVIAFCLRQPLLAEKSGLLYTTTATLPAKDYFVDGGWTYFDVVSNPSTLGISAAQISRYAARIPQIDGPRQLFAAILFPVVPGLGDISGQYDQLKIEAADYDDGFAKIVHVTQPVSANILSEDPDEIHVQKEIGFRLGWDDEQILTWQNRQILADPTTPGKRVDAPLGVFSYRVDVTEDVGKPSEEQVWNSLVRVRASDDLVLAGQDIAPKGQELELGVSVYPSRINADPGGAIWLPSYFTQWYGESLVLPDDRAAQLDETGVLADPGSYSDDGITAKKQQTTRFEPVLPRDVELKYGHQYEFRVRLSDLTGGGPLKDDIEVNDAPARSAASFFQRYIAPKQLKLVPKTLPPDPGGATTVFYPGTSFDVFRPRLGYPALLFTEMDTDTAFQHLLDDKKFLHTGKGPKEKIKEQREVSYFDPDVDQFMVIVELKTLLMDNDASRNGREAYIPLYRTFRRFPKNLEKAFQLELEYRDANVIDFGNQITLGDLHLSQAQIDAGTSIIVPTSRDVRLTLLPVTSDKPALPEYFGFAKTAFGQEFVRTGEPIQFFVRQDANAESQFFLVTPVSHQLQGIYLQPDPVQAFNPATIVRSAVEGRDANQSSVIDRLARQLGINSKGLSLIGRTGERIHFGCSKRIRNTLAPDASSITFSSTDALINHWLCVLDLEIGRDWTWDGLLDVGIEVRRRSQFTDEADTIKEESVGFVEVKNAASRLAITNPDRSRTRIIFIDAVEPKKEPGQQANPFPDTISLRYEVIPNFIASVAPASASQQHLFRELSLPVTTIPAQVPEVVAAGIALSPFKPSDDYAETAVRDRYLWLEFKEPILDPNDAYFARVLTYAPDPMLSYPSPDQVIAIQDDPPLDIDPELIRVITAGEGNDDAGLDAMLLMKAEIADPAQPTIKISPTHFLVPLPPGLHSESPELFGFFTYELRVGHTEKIWSTAQGRFGHPLRLNGVQHPVPPLKCVVGRDEKRLTVTAQHATAVFNGRNVSSRPSLTEIWCMLYAQLRQADNVQNRNLLLDEMKLEAVGMQTNVNEFLASRSIKDLRSFNSLLVTEDAPQVDVGSWTQEEIEAVLKEYALDPATNVSVLAVEMMPRYDRFVVFGDPPDTSVRPLSRELGKYRILRTSRLVAASSVCCTECK